MKNGKFTIGYLGPQGTHSEAACAHFFSSEHWDFTPFSTIDACIRATACHTVDACIVPIENSLEGSINITLDTLAHEVHLTIQQELVWRIHNHLMVKDAAAAVHTVISHPQPLAQCRRYLAEHYPAARLQTADSTVAAVELAAAGPAGYAAIANSKAAQLHNMTIVAHDIQDNQLNCTRFVVLGRPAAVPDSSMYKTSLVCRIKGDKPGSLFHLLQELVSHDINLVRIESRPARTALGEYIFFMDMEGSTSASNVAAALAALQRSTLWFKLLGSYPVYNAADI